MPSLLILLLLFLVCFGCDNKGLMIEPIGRGRGGDGISYASVWNGKADISWYNSTEIEFTISTPEQLAGFAELVNSGNNFKGKTVKLGSNIMLNDTANWQNWASSPPANKWMPIGKVDAGKRIDGSDGRYEPDTINSFNGIFDGNGFTVSGVYINSEIRRQGFFGYVGSGGAIKKLGAIASYIKGEYRWSGGLVGANYGSIISDSYFVGMVTGDGGLVGFNGEESTIINSYFSGTVTGDGGLVGDNYGKVSNSHSSGKVVGRQVGGLVGYNSGTGTISNSHSSSDVTGKYKAGGLVGKNFGKISNNYSTGAVTGEYDVGGLVGNNEGTISNSYSTGAVTGETDVGGLVGDNEGTISNSYFSGDVTGKYNAGGLVGENGGLIVNNYSIGAVAGKKNIGGLVGHNLGTVSNSHYNGQISKQSKGIGSQVYDSTKGKTTAEMQSKEFVDSLNFMAGLLSANAWVYSQGKYPVLSEQTAPMSNMDRFFAGGKGTETNPYIISTKKHLENLAYFVNSEVDFRGKHIKLSQTISFRNPFTKWTPIGSFEGTFDGNGFVIRYISGEGGLFGLLGASGTIKNLGVTDVDIEEGGGLVRYSKGTIINCYSTGKVSGEGYLGGLVGCNCGDSSRIINSYSTASVSGQDRVGGLVGINSGAINGSYSTGKVKGTAFALRPHGNIDTGGLVGDNEGSIINSHSSSDVTGQWDVGGLVGGNRGTISNSYSTGKVTGSLHVGGIAGMNYGTISGSYFTGKVKGNEDVGELVGSGKEAVDSYYGSEKK